MIKAFGGYVNLLYMMLTRYHGTALLLPLLPPPPPAPPPLYPMLASISGENLLKRPPQAFTDAPSTNTAPNTIHIEVDFITEAYN